MTLPDAAALAIVQQEHALEPFAGLLVMHVLLARVTGGWQLDAAEASIAYIPVFVVAFKEQSEEVFAVLWEQIRP